MAFEMWDDFDDGIIQYAIDAFASVEPWLYPFVFIGVIGFLYTAMNSVTVAIVGILITFALFAGTSGTNVFEGVPELSQFFYIVTIIGIACLIVTVFLKHRR